MVLKSKIKNIDMESVWEEPFYPNGKSYDKNNFSMDVFEGILTKEMVEKMLKKKNENKYFNFSNGRDITFMDSGVLTEFGEKKLGLRRSFGEFNTKTYIRVSYLAPVNDYYGNNLKERKVSLRGFHLPYFNCHVQINRFHDKHYLTERLFKKIEPILQKKNSKSFDSNYYSLDSFLADVL